MQADHQLQSKVLLLALLLLLMSFTCFLLFPDNYFRLQKQRLPHNAYVPQQVHISLGRDVSEMIVMWVTQHKTDTVVQYGKVSGELSLSVEGHDPVFYTFDPYVSGVIHTAVITGLQPSTTYYYKCGGLSGWSEEFSFTTAPKVGTFEVVIGTVGDMGTHSSSRRLAEVIKLHPELQMFWHVGDLSYADGKQPIWDVFGNMMQSVIASLPYMPLAGNHENANIERSFSPFALRYNMPLLTSYTGGDPERYYYSFDFGSVHFVNLDSEHDYAVGSAQYRWLETNLKAVDRKLTPWLVVGWHRPWYNSNWVHQGEAEKMRVALEELLYAHKVDLCVTGHVHAYERSHPVYKQEITPDGPVHITIGTGGTPEGLVNSWMRRPNWSVVRDASDWGFGRLQTFNATHAQWDFFHNDETIADSFMLVRQRPAH